MCFQAVLAHIDREMDSDGEYSDEPAGLSHDPEGGDAYVEEPGVYREPAEQEAQVVLDDDPVGPSTDPAPIHWPYHRNPYERYKKVYGKWRKDSLYNSLMTPSEVPWDWTAEQRADYTFQDRVRAYLTLNAFAPKGTVRSDSPEY